MNEVINSKVFLVSWNLYLIAGFIFCLMVLYNRSGFTNLENIQDLILIFFFWPVILVWELGMAIYGTIKGLIWRI